MTVRGFDVFDQMVAAAAVPPQAPPATPQPVAATATTIKPTATRAANRLLVAGVYMAVFAGLSLLAALLVTVTPLGAINLDVTQPFLATVAVAVMLTIIAVVRA
ncbi:MAG: hypothetical protein E6Q97_01120 [Desulfurellales bacterium]|nr:MAG: hypothetical protein E6Q97_01120 [Desulfurellales bacterium]